MGHIENYLSHLVLDLSQSPQTAKVDALMQSLSDASLQAFPLMTKELGKLMSTWPAAKFDSLSPSYQRD